MIALQGTYDNGTIRLDFPAPVPKAKVLVIFPNETVQEKPKNKFVASRFGVAKGKFDVPDDIDEDNAEIAAMFEGNIKMSLRRIEKDSLPSPLGRGDRRRRWVRFF